MGLEVVPGTYREVIILYCIYSYVPMYVVPLVATLSSRMHQFSSSMRSVRGLHLFYTALIVTRGSIYWRASFNGVNTALVSSNRSVFSGSVIVPGVLQEELECTVASAFQ